jgi:hypothetical protein
VFDIDVESEFHGEDGWSGVAVHLRVATPSILRFRRL